MTRSEFLFVLIDKLFDPSQNYRRYKNIVRKKDIVYSDRAPDLDTTAEVYYDPNLVGEGKPLLPVFVNIHGGGFVKGDKKYRRSICKLFANEGYFVYNINYALSPKNAFPQACIDCITALNYLEELAKVYNIDLTKVCVSGDSAGAHHATQLVALASNEDQRTAIGAPEFKVKPTLLVSFCGPYDLVASISLTKLPFNIVWDIGRCYIYNDTFKLKKDFSNMNDFPLLKEASPINWVNEKWCPAFLAISGKDIFCKGQGELLKQKLDDLGVENEVYITSKLLENHCFHLTLNTKASKECIKQVLAFMEKHLK